MNGGYCIIDCTGVDLGTLGEVPGFYEKVKNAINSKKPIVLSGIVNGNQAFTPIVAYGGYESANSAFMSFFPVTLHISTLDVITI